MARTPTVIVVGGGNAALCAAISAAEHGADVRLLERAPETLAGGNSRFTAGAMLGAPALIAMLAGFTLGRACALRRHR